ncbi:putative reverse transcriptase domain-containing protein, partial [Tanacetum coccineum]
MAGRPRRNTANNFNPPNEIADEVTRQLNTALPNLLTQLIQALGGNRTNQREEDFKKLLMEEYCPDDEIQKLEIELWNHKMVRSNIDGYTARFHELARLVPYMVTLENQRVNRYIRGLAPEILAHENARNKKRLNDQNKNQGRDDRNKRQRTERNFALTTPKQGQG